MVRRAVARARKFYDPHLGPDEEVAAVRNATAGGTGSLVGYGALIGALVGWLYSINVNGALLPAFVLGALAGELGGYLLAHRRARQPSGPGAVHLTLVQTNQRFFTLNRYAAVRRGLLREYPFDQVTADIAREYPIGNYRRLDITPIGGAVTSLIVEGTLDLP